MDLQAVVNTRLQAAGISQATPVLLAVSGGIDSMALWHILRALGQTHAVAHCNFNLRGDASDADAALVAETAQQQGITCHSTTFDTRAQATAEGISIQMAARKLRYDWFATLMEAHAYPYLLTAHHANDRTETLLWNLLRTKGIAVWEDLPAHTHNKLRPLLGATRTEIAAYVQAHAITYREDSSNASDHYPRNFLRHKVIPLLEELNPDLNAQLVHKATQGTLQEKVLATHILQPLLAKLSSPSSFELHGWPDEDVRTLALDTWLWQLALPYPLRQQVSSLIAAQKGSTVPWEAYSRIFVREANGIVWRDTADAMSPVSIAHLPAKRVAGEWALEFSTCAVPTLAELKADGARHYWDMAHTPLPWVLRPWQAGDAVQLLGAPGVRKVSDWLTDAKVPSHSRANTWVLCDAGGHIFYVQGLRVAHRCRISPATQEAAQLIVRRASL